MIFWFLILTLALSFACIKSYLVKHKIIEFKLVYFNPYAFLMSYINATKNQQGKIGIWFWILIVSFVSILLLGIAELIIDILSS
jgi:hypothetical protein